MLFEEICTKLQNMDHKLESQINGEETVKQENTALKEKFMERKSRIENLE